MSAYVIVGASLAGATAAITLREEGVNGTVTLIGAEQEPPYERPPLSKAYLCGDTPFDNVLVRPAAFYADHDIQTACYVNQGRIDAAVGLNRAKDVRRVMRLIKARRAVNLQQLRDESVDLRTIE